jgi:integrase
MKSGRTLKLADVPPYEALLDAVERLWNDYKRGKFKWFEREVEDVVALRDVALFAVLVFTGCRLGEALALTREDVDPKRKQAPKSKRGHHMRRQSAHV